MIDVIDGSDLLPEAPQETLGQVVERMARVVVIGGEPTAEEMDSLWTEAEASEAPVHQDAKPDVAAAFNRGAKLNLPEPPGGDVDPALKQRPKISSHKPASKGGRPAGSDELTGLFAAGMIMLISFALGDDFLPTEQEANDLARPVGNILARRIDLAAKLGQDANDTVAFAIAVMAYMVRVGPIAADKVRTWNADRQYRAERTIPDRPRDTVREGGVAHGSPAGSSAFDGETHNPLHALAQARAVGRGVLDRDLGSDKGPGLAVGAVG